MTYELPKEASKYLLESLSKRINVNSSDKLVEEKTKSLTKNTPSGGMGVGGPKGKKKDTETEASNVLFGDVEDEDLGMGAAAAAYGIGKGFETFADVLDVSGAEALGKTLGVALPKKAGFFGDIGRTLTSKAITAVPGLASKLSRQIADVSGSRWFDKNVGRIGQSAMELAAQGAGKPWTALAVPGPVKSRTRAFGEKIEEQTIVQETDMINSVSDLKANNFLIL